LAAFTVATTASGVAALTTTIVAATVDVIVDTAAVTSAI
jgi:hypothetical protein